MLHGGIALVGLDDVELFHGLVVPMVVVGHDPIRHGSNFEIFLRSPSHGRSASERACTSELACCEPLLRLSVEFPRAHLVAVHCWVSAWENGESNCVVNEREGWFSEVLDLLYDAAFFEEMAGDISRKSSNEVVLNDADPVSEVFYSGIKESIP